MRAVSKKNLDGIGKSRNKKIHPAKRRIVLRKITAGPWNIPPSKRTIRSPKVTTRIVLRPPSRRVVSSRRTSFLVGVSLLLVISFTAGMWFVSGTPHIWAKRSLEVKTTPPGIAASMGSVPQAEQNSGQLSNAEIFNTPIDLLQQYFAAPQPPDVMKVRAELLAKYLRERKSPLESDAQTIASQDHWKIILAISFAESTLGKHCYINNCSGIGGASIKTYPSVADWVIDFNKLLEKRYKDWTLKDMCGVYVKPCTQNWLLATSQILQDLDSRHIE